MGFGPELVEGGIMPRQSSRDNNVIVGRPRATISCRPYEYTRLMTRAVRSSACFTSPAWASTSS